MDDRPRPLSPTLRSRKRYIAFQLITEKKALAVDVFTGINHALLNFLGEFGMADADVWMSKANYEEEKQIGIIKCNHTSVEHVRLALALIQRIGDSRALVNVLGVSGTIKAAKKKFFGDVDLLNFG
ncbi:MAG: Rpp14/Pop5 family protein [Candidatus Aenigmarchaeota archaeon]|nr:Rpp14/Pop5 family protein [Candidatus Aenigmarchaeota archaeon]